MARIAGVSMIPPRQERSPYLAALVVLVLFVCWLIANGQDLVSAVLAAVAVSVATSRGLRVDRQGGA
jgi:hypothetical protein